MNLKRRQKSCVRHEIDPDEIFLDSKNLPGLDTDQFEGRIEKPISLASIIMLVSAFGLMLVILLGKAWVLQAKDGATYSAMSENNSMDQTVIYAERGAIFDRNGTKLAWNAIDPERQDFSIRAYTQDSGFGHILGYIKYPTKDKSGNYYQKNFVGVSGLEKYYNDMLQGTHGLKIMQSNALGDVDSESVIRPAVDGANLNLSIDAEVQKKLHESIAGLAEKVGFNGGGGIIMDVRTGEIIALTSYPEYKSSIMVEGSDRETITSYLTDSRKPLFNRVLSGLYTPGSIVKPYVALGALEEGTIDPKTKIISTGSISIPNPYDPKRKTTFMDWKAHGPVDMRRAIAVSSNVYFYEVGGGFEGVQGLGIERLNKYFSMFGFGKSTEDGFFASPAGTIPSPSWKEKVFPGDPWRIGDTYFTSIGQYGFQVTPFQMIRAVGTIANGGTYLTPTILKSSTSTPIVSTQVDIDPANFQIVREGMRQGATEGSASGLNVPYLKAAAKTGTAELGVSKAFVNSWVEGFFPYDNPQYAFVVVMEHGPRANVYGATYVMRELFDWMHLNYPKYIRAAE
ncbi:MAG TPA: penicillin-binding transpeptidase domain-containing protein [Candidatus Paceibacterota bacterium]